MEELQEQGEKQKKKQYDWLKPYHFKKGQSGNPKGRPPGKSLKTFLREYFESLSDEEKMDFFKHVNPELAWQMAEGKPDAKMDMTTKGEKIQSVTVKIIDGTQSPGDERSPEEPTEQEEDNG